MSDSGDIINGYRLMADNLLASLNEIKSRLNSSTTIDRQSKILLDYLSFSSLRMLSILFRYAAYHLELTDRLSNKISIIEAIIDSLPEEFYVQNKNLKHAITELRAEKNVDIKSVRDELKDLEEISKFVRWEKRYREDEVKDKEKENNNYH